MIYIPFDAVIYEWPIALKACFAKKKENTRVYLLNH